MHRGALCHGRSPLYTTHYTSACRPENLHLSKRDLPTQLQSCSCAPVPAAPVPPPEHLAAHHLHLLPEAEGPPSIHHRQEASGQLKQKRPPPSRCSAASNPSCLSSSRSRGRSSPPNPLSDPPRQAPPSIASLRVLSTWPEPPCRRMPRPRPSRPPESAGSIKPEHRKTAERESNEKTDVSVQRSNRKQQQQQQFVRERTVSAAFKAAVSQRPAAPSAPPAHAALKRTFGTLSPQSVTAISVSSAPMHPTPASANILIACGSEANTVHIKSA